MCAHNYPINGKPCPHCAREKSLAKRVATLERAVEFLLKHHKDQFPRPALIDFIR
jgi:DNA-binding helix-hairpin-helix protein with protein kinase domain